MRWSARAAMDRRWGVRGGTTRKPIGGRDVAADMLAAVATLTGKTDATQVNERFAGYHHRYPPPGRRASSGGLVDAAMPNAECSKTLASRFSAFQHSGIAAFLFLSPTR